MENNNQKTLEDQELIEQTAVTASERTSQTRQDPRPATPPVRPDRDDPDQRDDAAKHDPDSRPERPRRQRDKADPSGGHRHPPVSLDGIAALPEFRQDIAEIAGCLDGERAAALRAGELAKKWIGDARYSRVLNAERFAERFRQQTGREISGKQIKNYIIAYEMDLKIGGNQFPHLTPTHLAQIGASRCGSDDERIELAKRANEKKATVRQIRHLGQRLHAERQRAARLVDVRPLTASVHHVDGIDLLAEQKDKSVNCIIADWQWSDCNWGGHAEFPTVYVPADPVDHLCRSLQVAGAKLADDGLIYIFYSAIGFLNDRIRQTCDKVGFKHAGTYVWQKAAGAIMNGDTPLSVGHENIHILCRKDHSPKSACGYVNSVSRKLAAPTNAHSGQQHLAIHPHEKPVALMEQLISIATVNGLVVDLYAGSGSAGVAAIRRGCSYTGAELAAKYVDVANHRIAVANGSQDEVVEAVNWAYRSATPEQATIIADALKKSGLQLVQNDGEEVAA